MKLGSFQRINAEAAQRASAALSRLAGRPVSIEMPDVEIIRNMEIQPGLYREELVFGVYLPIGGPFSGAALLCFPPSDAETLGDELTSKLEGSAGGTRLMEDSTLKEVGNIICGNYVAVLANEMRTKIIPGLPRLARGMFGSMYRQIVAKLSLEARTLLLVRINLAFADKTLTARLLFLFDAGRLVEA